MREEDRADKTSDLLSWRVEKKKALPTGRNNCVFLALVLSVKFNNYLLPQKQYIFGFRGVAIDLCCCFMLDFGRRVEVNERGHHQEIKGCDVTGVVVSP